MTYPIPQDALDDRLGWIGATGSGKTYNAGVGVERLLAAKARVIIFDPLDVWWGLRLREDGKTASGFSPVIFGGPHGDLPLNERSGALLGETIASMKESCIVSLADFKSGAAERRFMLDLLSSLDRNATREPVHLIFDEADLWAPQVVLDKEGDANKLLGQMQTIVRRGRIKGFIPWLVTQRPAEISKGVLSQIDGMIAFKLTSSQDRAAIGGWIKGQADAEVGTKILASLPTMQVGQGVVWVPGRQVLATAQFPAKITFDSSRTPRRGEKKSSATLKSLDLGALKDRLAEVEAEAKANDPKALKAEVARLTKELSKAPAPAASPAEQQAAEARGYERGHDDGGAQVLKAMAGIAGDLAASVAAAKDACERSERLLKSFGVFAETQGISRATPRPSVAPKPPEPRAVAVAAPRAEPRAATDGALTGPQRRILNALAWWAAFGIDQPTNEQFAFIAGYAPGSGNFNNLKSGLRVAGLLDYPAPGRATLSPAGAAIAETPDLQINQAAFHDQVRSKLKGPQLKLLEPVLAAYPLAVTADDMASAAGYAAGSGNFNNLRSSLRTIGLIDYPAPGQVRAADWLFPTGEQ